MPGAAALSAAVERQQRQQRVNAVCQEDSGSNTEDIEMEAAEQIQSGAAPPLEDSSDDQHAVFDGSSEEMRQHSVLRDASSDDDLYGDYGAYAVHQCSDGSDTDISVYGEDRRGCFASRPSRWHDSYVPAPSLFLSGDIESNPGPTRDRRSIGKPFVRRPRCELSAIVLFSQLFFQPTASFSFATFDPLASTPLASGSPHV